MAMIILIYSFPISLHVLMIPHITMRRAEPKDLPFIIELLAHDPLGKTREITSEKIDPRYLSAFTRIMNDPNQFLMVVIHDEQVIGTCHLTLLPSLTYVGSTRMQIEAVRIAEGYRGQKIGEWMFGEAIKIAKNHAVTIIQLTTNAERPEAKRFYEKLGFQASHIGMKLFL